MMTIDIHYDDDAQSTHLDFLVLLFDGVAKFANPARTNVDEMCMITMVKMIMMMITIMRKICFQNDDPCKR